MRPDLSETEIAILTGMRRTWLVGFGFGVGRTSWIAMVLGFDNRSTLRRLRRMEKRGLVKLLPERCNAYDGLMWAETDASAATPLPLVGARTP